MFISIHQFTLRLHRLILKLLTVSVYTIGIVLYFYHAAALASWKFIKCVAAHTFCIPQRENMCALLLNKLLLTVHCQVYLFCIWLSARNTKPFGCSVMQDVVSVACCHPIKCTLSSRTHTRTLTMTLLWTSTKCIKWKKRISCWKSNWIPNVCDIACMRTRNFNGLSRVWDSDPIRACTQYVEQGMHELDCVTFPATSTHHPWAMIFCKSNSSVESTTLSRILGF